MGFRVFLCLVRQEKVLLEEKPLLHQSPRKPSVLRGSAFVARLGYGSHIPDLCLKHTSTLYSASGVLRVQNVGKLWGFPTPTCHFISKSLMVGFGVQK